MVIHSFNFESDFDSQRIQTKVILETSFSKEIRILLADGQSMKEHKAPFPIIIHVLQGCINLGSEGEINEMHTNDIISLAANVPHDLFAKEKTIIRLSLFKSDTVERVLNVIK